MTREEQITGWMRDDTHVRAIYATGPGVHVEGRIIAYQDRPSVVIETDAGERVSWAAHLVEEGGASTAPVRAVGEELRCDVCQVRALDCRRDPRLPVTYFIRQGLCGPCSRKPSPAPLNAEEQS